MSNDSPEDPARARLEVELARAARELADARQELRAIQATLSWRITAPLRWTRARLTDLQRAGGGLRARAQAAARPAAAEGDRIDLCILVHLYHVELWSDLERYLQNTYAVGAEVFVNLVAETWTPEVVVEIRRSFPRARIYISPNRGLDIGGLFQLMKVVDFSRYTAFCLVHGKKSPHLPSWQARHWRESMLEGILSSPEQVQRNVQAFEQDPALGIIGSARHRDNNIAGNAVHYNTLLRLYRIKGPAARCDYLSGSFMMIRSELLRSVYVPLADEEFEHQADVPDELRHDGQLAHAVERIIGAVARRDGYRILWQ